MYNFICVLYMCIHRHAAYKMLVTQLCQTLCDPLDCSPPGSSVHWISKARILEWIGICFSRGSSQPRDWTHISCLAGRFVTTEPPGEKKKKKYIYIYIYIIYMYVGVCVCIYIYIYIYNTYILFFSYDFGCTIICQSSHLTICTLFSQYIKFFILNLMVQLWFHLWN